MTSDSKLLKAILPVRVLPIKSGPTCAECGEELKTKVGFFTTSEGEFDFEFLECLNGCDLDEVGILEWRSIK